MPSFFSKVGLFSSRKKNEHVTPSASAHHQHKKGQDSVSSNLIDGQKYEVISTPTSPAAAEFAMNAQEGAKPSKDKGKQVAKTPLFRPGSPRLTSNAKKSGTTEIPQISLNLPGVEGKRDISLDAALGLRSGSPVLLDWQVLGARRLTPGEALTLIQACAQIINSRGLESLGIMHPHWHSSSPEDQRRIISYFLEALARPNANEFQASTFKAELRHSRSPHDPAAVLRWGIRHLNNEGKPFGDGKDGKGGKWGWYQLFSEVERSKSFPSFGFSECLLPLLPECNSKLLQAILNLTAALASHSEMNGISGSKLSKMLGYWLLSTRDLSNAHWESFYNEWSEAGRIMEHIFLAYLRDTTMHPRPAPRLLELTHSYPYGPTDGIFLARPRISSRTYNALYIQLDIKRKNGRNRRSYSALDLVSQALVANISIESQIKEEVLALASAIQHGARLLTVDEQQPNGHSETKVAEKRSKAFLTNVFSDESVRLLQLQASGESTDALTRSSSLLTNDPGSFRIHRRSISLDDGVPLKRDDSNVTNKPNSLRKVPNAVSPISTGLGTDWASFSSSGFFDGVDGLGSNLAATLMDKDIEVSNPSPVPTKKLSLKRKANDRDMHEASHTKPEKLKTAEPPDSFSILTCSLTTIDEAFVDFWSDALLDPISKDWPLFALCQLKPSSTTSFDEKSISWVIFEGKHSEEDPPKSSLLSLPARPVSPTLSMNSSRGFRSRSRQESVSSKPSSQKQKRIFGFLSTSGRHNKIATTESVSSTLNVKEVGEMGELLPGVQQKKAESEMSSDAKMSISPTKPESISSPPIEIETNSVPPVIIEEPEVKASDGDLKESSKNPESIGSRLVVDLTTSQVESTLNQDSALTINHDPKSIPEDVVTDLTLKKKASGSKFVEQVTEPTIVNVTGSSLPMVAATDIDKDVNKSNTHLVETEQPSETVLVNGPIGETVAPLSEPHTDELKNNEHLPTAIESSGSAYEMATGEFAEKIVHETTEEPASEVPADANTSFINEAAITNTALVEDITHMPTSSGEESNREAVPISELGTAPESNEIQAPLESEMVSNANQADLPAENQAVHTQADLTSESVLETTTSPLSLPLPPSPQPEQLKEDVMEETSSSVEKVHQAEVVNQESQQTESLSRYGDGETETETEKREEEE